MQNINKISFNKKPKTSEELIQQLKDRGMIIKDEDFAKKILSKVSYYRLSGYWFKYQNKWFNKNTTYSTQQEKETIENEFVKEISFENISDIYKFDSKLRSLCFDALEKIEVSMNTAISDYMCNKYGAYWFMDKSNIDTKTYTKKQLDGTIKEITIFSHKKFIEQIDQDIQKNNKAPFIKSFYSKYNDKYPPYWIISQIITFGTISKIYTTIPRIDKESIAKNLNFTRKFLEKSLVSLSYIRNICAHYSRLWDKEYSLTPGDINFKVNNKNNIYNYSFNSLKNNASFFHIFYTITLFLINLYPKSKWVSLVNNKIKEYQEKTNNLVSFKNMGFPNNWQELPLFKAMLENK